MSIVLVDRIFIANYFDLIISLFELCLLQTTLPRAAWWENRNLARKLYCLFREHQIEN